jgi:hypothetical protein
MRRLADIESKTERQKDRKKDRQINRLRQRDADRPSRDTDRYRQAIEERKAFNIVTSLLTKLLQGAFSGHPRS